MKNPSFSYKCATLICINFLILLILMLHGPLATPTRYQTYIDTRTWLGIPNAWDVISNLPYFIAGIWGLWEIARTNNRHGISFNNPNEKLFYVIFFIGLILIGFGSSYYHWTLNHFSLLCDRAPITIAMAGIVSAMIAERIDQPFARFIVWPLLILGIFSAYYWYFTIQQGREDIRLYTYTVAFIPFFTVPRILLMFKKTYTQIQYVWIGLILYVFARIAESYDTGLYVLTDHFISGHALKHLLIGISSLLIVVYLIRRKSCLSIA